MQPKHDAAREFRPGLSIRLLAVIVLLGVISAGAMLVAFHLTNRRIAELEQRILANETERIDAVSDLREQSDAIQLSVGIRVDDLEARINQHQQKIAIVDLDKLVQELLFRLSSETHDGVNEALNEIEQLQRRYMAGSITQNEYVRALEVLQIDALVHAVGAELDLLDAVDSLGVFASSPSTEVIEIRNGTLLIQEKVLAIQESRQIDSFKLALLEDELSLVQSQVTLALTRWIRDFAAEVAQDLDYDIVLDRGATILVTQSIDITESVILKLE